MRTKETPKSRSPNAAKPSAHFFLRWTAAPPLLGNAISNVLLHFQFGPDGSFSSPEIPAASERRLA
jgi:hypothetical protein